MMTSSPSLRWSDSEDDFTNISRNLFQTTTPHDSETQDDLPPSSPPKDFPSSSPPKDTPQTPTHHEVPTTSPHQELETPGPYLSSIIRGTRQERAAHRRRKAHKKHRETLAQQRQEADKEAQEHRKKDLDAVLDCLRSKGLRFFDLMEYVFNYSNGRGDIRWHDFFIHEGAATRILELWASSRNAQGARQEVVNWAIEYTTHTVAREARTVTKSKELQTIGKKINQKIITSFSFSDMHDLLQDEMAPVAMTIFRAFSTSRHAHKHTEQRKEKTSVVSRVVYPISVLKMSQCAMSDQVVTSAALSCLGEYSHANNLAKRVIGLYLYATGAQRQSIHVLSTLGLSESYSNLITRNIYRKRKTAKNAKDSEQAAAEGSDSDSEQVRRTGTLHQLSESMREKTQELAATGLFGVVYDNINIDLRNAEQIVGRHGASLSYFFTLNSAEFILQRFTREWHLCDSLSLTQRQGRRYKNQ